MGEGRRRHWIDCGVDVLVSAGRDVVERLLEGTELRRFSG